MVEATMKANKKLPFHGKTALIIGGSKGIGKATASELIKQGANVCIVARTKPILESVKTELENQKISEEQQVKIIAADATKEEDLKPLLEDYINRIGVPDYLINSVGVAKPGYVQDYSVKDYEDAMRVNYMSSVIPITIILPHFLEKKQGHIVIISSGSGFVGIMGYVTYTPTKFALVGLAESLRNELKPYNIRISVVYPVDTATPGFEIENKAKPKECEIISSIGKLMEPEEAAKKIVKGILKRKFNILLGRAGLFHWLKRHIPSLVFWFIDRDLKKARKKLGKE